MASLLTALSVAGNGTALGVSSVGSDPTWVQQPQYLDSG